MCVWITVRATTAEGEPRGDIPPVEFEVPERFTPEYPTCTCNIGNKDDKDGDTLRHTFADTVLREFFNKVSFGNIVIELR